MPSRKPWKEYQLDVFPDPEQDIFERWADSLHELGWFVGRWRPVTRGPDAENRTQITKASMEHANLRYIKKPHPRWDLYFWEDSGSSKPPTPPPP